MSTLKPVIGVTGPDAGGTAAWIFTKMAVRIAGGKAKRITPSAPVEISLLDGIIFGGGADVAPELYGESKQEAILEDRQKWKKLKKNIINIITLPLYPSLYLIRKLFSAKTSLHIKDGRDALEYYLMEQAIQRKIPILGICRGAQLLNVYFGGSLYQNVKEFYKELPEIRSVLPKKNIFIKENSKLYAILQTNRCNVNALHKQAINKLGKDIESVAQEQNSIIQAIEHKLLPFAIGVQWHPEYMPQDKKQKAIFKSMIQASLQHNLI